MLRHENYIGVIGAMDGLILVKNTINKLLKMTKIEIRNQGTNKLIYEVQRDSFILPQIDNMIVVATGTYKVANLYHHLNENKIIIKVIKF